MIKETLDELNRDDEEVINDSEIEGGDLTTSFFEQYKGAEAVGVSVIGLVDDSGKLNSPRELESNPPTLVIKSTDGDLAEFKLTRKFNRSIKKYFTAVDNAYYGIDSITDRDNKLFGKIRRADVVWFCITLVLFVSLVLK